MDKKILYEKLDLIRRQQGWSSRELATGRNYQLKGKTTISVYYGNTDIPGSLEIAFEVNTIADTTGKTASQVNDWIKYLQETVGCFAQPKTRYRYPRVAIENGEQALRLASEIGDYFSKNTSNKDTSIPIGKAIDDDDFSIDERILSSIWSRRGQKRFREKLLKAYAGKCAITKCDTEEALEAAHIVPHAEELSYQVSNGLLLRADIHTLFDLSLISVNPESGRVVLADECKSSYGYLEGSRLRIPNAKADWPNPQALRMHYERWEKRSAFR